MALDLPPSTYPISSRVQPVLTPAAGKDMDLFARPNEYDQLKGHFLACLNHELRTPLSGVLGMTDLLLESSLDVEQTEYVLTIRECASQLLDTLNSVLDYSALTAGNFQIEGSEFALRGLIEAVEGEIRPKAQGKGLEFQTSWDATVPETVVGDDRYIRQIVLHLLRNAVKFTFRGAVELRVLIEAASDGRAWLRVEVADSGIGIPPEKLKLIFESFRQLDSGLARQYPGLGLGLALSEKMARLMGGEIVVLSEPGTGSMFALRLPLRRAGAGERAGVVGNVLDDRERPAALILVVEDSSIAQQIVRHALERGGYPAEFASTGEAALELAEGKRFGMILMDLQMTGIDGLETTRRIRNLAGYEKVPILALSANYSDEHRQLCHQAGMQGFLAKPVERDELLRTVRLYLGDPPPASR